MLWETLPQSPAGGRAGHTATLVGSRILVYGGRLDGKTFGDLWEFDTEQEQWRQLQKEAQIPSRAYHSATLLGSNQLWIFGGIHGKEVLSDVRVLNTETLEWRSPVLRSQGTPRAFHAAVAQPLHPKCILLFGGFAGSSNCWLDDLIVLDTDILQWRVLQPGGRCPSPRGCHTMTKFGHKVLLFGGRNDGGAEVEDDDLNVFDGFANRWIQVKPSGDVPCARSSHAAALAHGNSIVIHGGRARQSFAKDCYSLKISDNLYIWSKHNRATAAARSSHCLVACGEAVYMFGGISREGATASDVYVVRNLTQAAQLNAEIDEAAGGRTCSRAKRQLPPDSEVQVTSTQRIVLDVARLQMESSQTRWQPRIEEIGEQVGNGQERLEERGLVACRRKPDLSRLLTEALEAGTALEEEKEELFSQLRAAEAKIQEQETSLERARKSHEDAIRALEVKHHQKIKLIEQTLLLQEINVAEEKLAAQEAFRAMEEQLNQANEKLDQHRREKGELSRTHAAELQQVKALKIEAVSALINEDCAELACNET